MGRNSPNHAINADSEKRRSLVALRFTAGYDERRAWNPWQEQSDGNRFLV